MPNSLFQNFTLEVQARSRPVEFTGRARRQQSLHVSLFGPWGRIHNTSFYCKLANGLIKQVRLFMARISSQEFCNILALGPFVSGMVPDSSASLRLGLN
jgi:hypothetical protein